ncbi:hypothetical protein BT69DRAFT_1278851 [Atractiella rhizophila]|nr:hypothetical protein BT69DRAFT_1278851 [Atractiella rhizophila]
MSEEILKPILLLPNSCRVCGVEGRVQRCSRCLAYVAYCDRECQSVDWPSHKRVCGVVATVLPDVEEWRNKFMGNLKVQASRALQFSSANQPQVHEHYFLLDLFIVPSTVQEHNQTPIEKRYALDYVTLIPLPKGTNTRTSPSDSTSLFTPAEHEKVEKIVDASRIIQAEGGKGISVWLLRFRFPTPTQKREMDSEFAECELGPPGGDLPIFRYYGLRHSAGDEDGCRDDIAEEEGIVLKVLMPLDMTGTKELPMMKLMDMVGIGWEECLGWAFWRGLTDQRIPLLRKELRVGEEK